MPELIVEGLPHSILRNSLQCARITLLYFSFAFSLIGLGYLLFACSSSKNTFSKTLLLFSLNSFTNIKLYRIFSKCLLYGTLIWLVIIL